MSGPMLSFADELHQSVHQWLVEEAELLDDRRYEEWLELLTDDVVYRMPVRVTSAHSLEDSTLDDMDHLIEDRYSLGKRVERFQTEHAWTEDPPSRTRHYVTNVRVWRGESEGELIAKAYVLVFRSRGDVREPDLVSAERTDVLRRVNGGLRLARREVLVDESVLRTQNLAIFI